MKKKKERHYIHIEHRIKNAGERRSWEFCGFRMTNLSLGLCDLKFVSLGCKGDNSDNSQDRLKS